ncbi:hypothetical protein CEXT_796931 [Caerostris extrusa]|uniref:Uncharacterized protein n=1 Tax=Caerostris extrusa TaxID=172846 RepID=A0AAV4XA75_CAEEX|nr:hypothetical protein CEXT_796931 [Caerostris extrusa]
MNESELTTEVKLKPLFFTNPCKDWLIFLKNLKSTIPSLKSNRFIVHFLKITVENEANFNLLKSTLITKQIAFKSLHLKRYQSLKVVLGRLPTSTNKEEIEA